MKESIRLPEISDKDKSPQDEQLLAIIEQQIIAVQQQAEEIRNVAKETARFQVTIKPAFLTSRICSICKTRSTKL